MYYTSYTIQYSTQEGTVLHFIHYSTQEDYTTLHTQYTIVHERLDTHYTTVNKSGVLHLIHNTLDSSSNLHTVAKVSCFYRTEFIHSDNIFY